jgi:hypothetical protein
MALTAVSGGWVIKQRFIAIPDTNNFVLADYKFWAEHEQELDQWCKKNFCVRKGMTVTALNEYGYILFGLKWSV